MSSSITDSKTQLSNSITDLKVHAGMLQAAQDREKQIAALRANASSELKALKGLKAAFEPEIARLATIDLSPLKNAGANLDALNDAPNIVASLDKAIAGNQGITDGTVDAAKLLDAPQPFDTAATLQGRIETLIEAVVKLSN